MSTREIGVDGEDIASAYLERQGYDICLKNWTIPGGELDIIAYKDGVTVFVEVKFRTNTVRGHSRESLSFQKKRHLRRSGLLYATKNGLTEEMIRFDFIAIQKRSRCFHLEHFINIEI